MKTVIVFLALSLSVFGCNGSPKAAAGKQAETDAQTVEVVPVASQKLVTVFTLPAQLIPFQTVDIYPKVTAFMDMIRVDLGSRLHTGELLIRLSAPAPSAHPSPPPPTPRPPQPHFTTARAT